MNQGNVPDCGESQYRNLFNLITCYYKINGPFEYEIIKVNKVRKPLMEICDYTIPLYLDNNIEID